MDFFFGYDQVELGKEFRDLTTFMTRLGLMRITTLAQGATNLVAPFVRIVFKILVPYLRDRVKPFIDNLRIKRSKTTYINGKLAPEIRRYMVEHIQNLD